MTVDRYTCEQVFARINDYLDRELSAEDMARVRAHLDTCAQCTAEYRFEGTVLEDIKAKLRRIDLPAEVLDRIREMLRTRSA